VGQGTCDVLFLKIIFVQKSITEIAIFLLKKKLRKKHEKKYKEGNKFVIPYFYQAGYSEELKIDISRALRDLGENTCIDFKTVTEDSKGKYMTHKIMTHHDSYNMSHDES